MRASLALLAALALTGCYEVVDLSPPTPDAGGESDADLGDAQAPGDAFDDAGLPDAAE